MRLRQKTLSPVLRYFARAALVAFVVAQTLCFVHCNFGGGHGDSAPPSCHSSALPQACHDEDGAPPESAPSKATSCSTLQNLFLGDSPTVPVPEFYPLHTPVSFALELNLTAKEPGTSIYRQGTHGDWVLTPEVSLGPAFRSLAPPFVA